MAIYKKHPKRVHPHILYPYINWTEVQPYNISRANGSFLFNSEGMIYFVELDFSPV